MFKHYIRRPRLRPHTQYDTATLCQAYNFPKVSAPDGATIGIIELGGGYDPADIKAAFAAWKLPAPIITDVSVQGATNSPGDDADAEVVLDIEVSAAAYSYCTGKAARVWVYFAPNSDSGFAAAIQQAVDDGCTTISVSWGAPEDQWSSSGIKAMQAAIAAAAAKGIPVFVASGDNDSSDGESGKHLDYPSSDPNAIGCGGTSKTVSAEVVWNDGQGGGTGGGYSSLFPTQSWQVGAPGGPGRMVPDCAANADPQTGYNVFLNGSWQVIGGTSAVAPLYAGLYGAIIAATGAAIKPASVWNLKNAYVDITKGDNGAFAAIVGPDPCTGVGVPNGAAILTSLSGSTPTPPPVPPPPVPPPPPAPTPTPTAGPIQTVIDVLNGLSAAGWSVGKILKKLPTIVKDVTAGETSDEILQSLLGHNHRVLLGAGPFTKAHLLGGGWLRRELEHLLFERVVSAGMDAEQAASAIGSGKFGVIIEWVLNNAPQIYAWVSAILAIFGVPPLPPLPPIPLPPLPPLPSVASAKCCLSA